MEFGLNSILNWFTPAADSTKPAAGGGGGGFLGALLPSLAVGGLNALSQYQTNKAQGSQADAALKLQQDRFAFEKELALKKLAEGDGGAAGLQASIARAQLEAQRQQMIQAAYASAAAGALRAGEGSSSNLTNVGSLMTRPFIR